jgi:hypothetical protein
MAAMKQISLGNGLFTTVDDADFELVSSMKWKPLTKPDGQIYAGNRRQHRGVMKRTRMHTFLMGGMCDHRDGNGLNNCRENLRLCTHQQNAGNRRMESTNPVGFKGVQVHKKTMTYRGMCGGKSTGYFRDPVSAARAYDRAAVARWGEFACVNFPEDFPGMNLRCARVRHPTSFANAS